MRRRKTLLRLATVSNQENKIYMGGSDEKGSLNRALHGDWNWNSVRPAGPGRGPDAYAQDAVVVAGERDAAGELHLLRRPGRQAVRWQLADRRHAGRPGGAGVRS